MKTRNIRISLTEEDYQLIADKAKELRMALGPYCRALVFNSIKSDNAKP